MLNHFEDKNHSIDKKLGTSKEEIITASVKENIQMTLSNENVFKIVVILISCLNKLLHTGNSKQIFLMYNYHCLFLLFYVYSHQR